MMRPATTILVESNSIFREGLRVILETTKFKSLKMAASIDDIPPQLLDGSRPVLILLGLEDNHQDTARAVQRLKQQNPMAWIVVLGDRCESEEALVLLRSGADGYLLRKISCDALIKSLDLLMLGLRVFPSTVSQVLGAPSERGCEQRREYAPRRLSDRETGILRCLMRGEANKVIARQFDISEATVKVHIKAILRKTRARNRTQAAVWPRSSLGWPLPAGGACGEMQPDARHRQGCRHQPQDPGAGGLSGHGT
jgi:two-component system nitrate/nitrite response regulator NarL